MIIQIKPYPVALTGDPVTEEEQHWAVYLGEPGNFEWLADFAQKKHAEFFARVFALAQNTTAEYWE